tara:strand:- start:38 stop:577 length:540 start_codon:yes stop_codon:yes gene_type:complete
MDFKYSKYIGSILIFIFLSVQLIAQGNNLQFSRIIDTVLKVEVSSCTNLYTTKVFGSSMTVPSNTVWKITSYSNMSTVNSSSDPNDWDDLNYESYYCTGSKYTSEAGFKSDILKNVNGDYIIIFPSGSTNTLMPVWLNAGTELKASFYSTSGNFRQTWQAWLPYKSYVNLSIIEFNIVP